ncbi:TylF/MycF/NovP-related O-methyltransferase [Streptomyces sp. NPDC004296]|uniref:TylF/MycF/NovP-related O-methyltransferase n=1 Tax=Streptomyces sp. NPDC004296 TaxID=3364697 RepID=UPI00369A80F9
MATGEFAAPATEVRTLHETWGLPQPVVHEGWFDRTLPGDLPERIAFGYLDADRYASTLTCLRACVPRLPAGAVLVLDDYADASAPGADRGNPAHEFPPWESRRAGNPPPGTVSAPDGTSKGPTANGGALRHRAR